MDWTQPTWIIHEPCDLSSFPADLTEMNREYGHGSMSYYGKFFPLAGFQQICSCFISVRLDIISYFGQSLWAESDGLYFNTKPAYLNFLGHTSAPWKGMVFFWELSWCKTEVWRSRKVLFHLWVAVGVQMYICNSVAQVVSISGDAKAISSWWLLYLQSPTLFGLSLPVNLRWHW